MPSPNTKIEINSPAQPVQMANTEMINQEIKRISELLEKQELHWETQKLIGSLANMEENPSPQYTICKKYYTTAIEYLKVKRKFWSQFRDRSMDKNALDNIQGLMDDWYRYSLDYLGQEDIINSSKLAKEEFQMFKAMYNYCPKKQRRKNKKK